MQPILVTHFTHALQYIVALTASAVWPAQNRHRANVADNTPPCELSFAAHPKNQLPLLTTRHLTSYEGGLSSGMEARKEREGGKAGFLCAKTQ